MNRRERIRIVLIVGVGDEPAFEAVLEQCRERRADLFGFDEEGVVAVVGFDDVVGDVDVGLAGGLCERLGLFDGEVPVAGKREEQEFALEGGQCVGVAS